MAEILTELRKIPPVTRFLCASSVAVSVPVMLQLVSPYAVLFVRPLVTKRFQLWRIWSSFFLGSSGLNYVFDLVMLYRTSNSLEMGDYPGRSPDLAWQLLLASAGILGLNIPINTYVHTRALLLALVYLSAKTSPDTQTSLMGLVSIPHAYFPYVLIGLDLVTGGPAAAATAVSGAVVGHLWWWAVFAQHGGGARRIPDWARAPAWLRGFVSEGPAADGGSAAAGGGTGVHVIPPRGARNAGASAGTSTGYRWGSGNRLGTD